MPTRGAYTASILVNKAALKEYDPPTDERAGQDTATQVITFIEALEGAEFEIKVRASADALFPISM